MSKPMEAGRGENHVYRLVPPNQGEPGPLRPEHHYVGVDSACWFINKQSNWFKNRTASGTMQITMDDGREEYNVALGTFELKDGSRTAPVFDKPVLPDRRYRGGVLTCRVSLVGLDRDTALATILKGAAEASLNIVSGMVETATAAGPQQILGAAGGTLVRGIADTLANSAPGRSPIFSGDGIEVSIPAARIDFPEVYLLFHRGSRLDPRLLKTASYGAVRLPIYNGRPLADGAWLLLRIRRSTGYGGVRPWFDHERQLLGRLKDLVSDVEQQLRSSGDALGQFSNSAGGSNLRTEFDSLRRVIRSDGVLTKQEADQRVSALTRAFGDARAHIIAHPSGHAPATPSATARAALAVPDAGIAVVEEDWLENVELPSTVIERLSDAELGDSAEDESAATPE